MAIAIDFDDIRPYRDDELPAAINELLNDREFLGAISSLRLDWLPRFLAPLAHPFVRFRLRQYTRGLNTVVDFQKRVEDYLQRCVDSTSDGFQVRGDELLEVNKSYLFISNHRDIVMDPALCNLAIHRISLGTCRIAVGDNLLSKKFAEHLMRINKSFIVKRAVGRARDKLRELKKLSNYIRQSVMTDREHVWIAQKEGRAKNGLDLSDPTLIKMLMLSKNRDEGFSESLRQLNIMPVAVSYEWDPCDVAKARELASIQTVGKYQKAEHEDIQSIALGIQGYKGRISLAFGKPLEDGLTSVEEVATALDQQIIKMYRLYPSHLAAYKRLNGVVPELSEQYSETELVEADKKLSKRLDGLGDVEAQLMLQAYANPVASRLNLSSSDFVKA